MPQLERTRSGWNAERLAEFLLAKIGFVAAPTVVADDVGVDFYCTLFHRLPGKHVQLVPSLPLAVQVKSSLNTVRLTTAIGALRHLNVPFFVAVANVNRGSAELYSGRYLRYALDLHGVPSGLTAKLVARRLSADAAVTRTTTTPLRLRVAMPRIGGWGVKSSQKALYRLRGILERECLEAGLNNYQSAAGQFLFRFTGPRHVRVLAGSGSVRLFRAVMADRLTEYARNLQWLCEQRGQARAREQRAFLEAARLLRNFVPHPRHLSSALTALREARCG